MKKWNKRENQKKEDNRSEESNKKIRDLRQKGRDNKIWNWFLKDSISRFISLKRKQVRECQ